MDRSRTIRWAITVLTVGLPLGSPVALGQQVEAAKLWVPGDDHVFQDRFANAVAVTDELALVGEPYDDNENGNSAQGAAYLFQRGPGGWSLLQDLVVPDGEPGDLFGFSLAVDRDTAVVGSPLDDDAGWQSGSAYVFRRGPKKWLLRSKIAYPGTGQQIGFANDVSMDGTRLLIGAGGDEEGGQGRGAAFVFERQGTQWIQTAKLIPSDPLGNFYYGAGRRVALDGDVAVLGAEEVAFVFERTPNGWLETAALTDPTPDSFGNDSFGWGVAVEGDLIVVGEPVESCPWFMRPGSALVFERQGPGPGNWKLVQELKASNAAGWNCESDRFGQTVAIREGRILVGAPVAGEDHFHKYGNAYLFEKSVNSWVETRRFEASDAEDGDRFGHEVTLSESFVLAGAPYGHGPLPVKSGVAYVFELPLGEVYCPSAPNSTGAPASLEARGSVEARVGALRLLGLDLPPHVPGTFLASRDLGLVFPPGSQGVLCMGRPVAVLGGVIDSGTEGVIEHVVDTTDLPISPGAILPGDTWHFQAWFRDRNPGPTSNFSAGVRLTYR